VAADPDGNRAGGRARADAHVVEREELALESHAFVLPAGAHDADRLVAPGSAPLVLDAEQLDLLLHPAHAGTEDHAARRHVVDGGQHLGGEHRMAVRQHEHARAQPDLAGEAGHQRQHGQRLEEVGLGREREIAGGVVRVARANGVGQDHMIAHPQRVVAERLGATREQRERLPRGRRPVDRQMAPDVHAWTTRSVSSPPWIIWASRERWILPLEVLGMVLLRTSSMREGRCPRLLCMRPTISFTSSRYSCSCAVSLRTSATTCSRWVPVRSLSTPMAVEYRISGTWSTTSSMSAGSTFSPPRMMMSLSRPVMNMYPALSTKPRS